MGLRGRFMVLGAAGVGVSFIGYCIAAFIFGHPAGLGICALLAGVSLATIFNKQKQGLYNNKKCRDNLIYKYDFTHK